MNEKPPSEGGNSPNLGSATTKVVELIERSLAEKADLKKWIDELWSKSNPTIRDRLCLALYRHQLSFREPPLPPEVPLNGVNLWEYWASHNAEYRKYRRLEDGIWSYLEPPETLHGREVTTKRAMIELIQKDSVTFLALYPVIDKMFGKLQKKSGRGRPVTRRLTAVRALQLCIDKNWTLSRITREVCDCGNATHEDRCQQRIRQSMSGLKKLLIRCGIKLADLSPSATRV
jgi:hypothetical protein